MNEPTRKLADSLEMIKHGRLDDAVAAQASLRRQLPDRAECFFAQALLLLCQQDDVALDAVVEQALQRQSEPFFTHIYLALRALIARQYDTALRQAVEAHNLDSTQPYALMVAAFTQLRLDRFTEAFHNLTKARRLFQPPQVMNILRLRCLEQIEATKYSQPLADGAIEYLQQPWFNYTRIARLVSTLIAQQLALDSATPVTDFATIADIALLNLALDKMILREAKLEQLLVQVRQYLLIQLYEQKAVTTPTLVFAAKLALQCFYNEYVYDETADESTLIDALASTVEKTLSSSSEPSAALTCRLLAIALYRPLQTLNGIAQLNVAQDHPLAQLLGITVRNPQRERDIAATIPVLGNISDDISVRVQAQYEQNPYPRWISFDQLILRKDYFSVAASELQSQGITPPAFKKPTASRPLRILIAGCGTGQHAISVANRFEHATVTAIDISMASLAYAKRMAQHYQVNNLEFMQCDILAIGDIGKRFDVIESVGTLHHMDSPDAGLKALTQVLEPHGLMRIGLYSKLARRAISQVRETDAAELIARFDVAKLRQLRHHMLTRQAGNPLLDIADFYSTSGCRDLLCHVQEHQYSIEGIKQLLHNCGLRFVGFNFQSGRHEGRLLFRELFGNDAALDNLGRWNEVETRMPDLFSEMYIFYACRQPDA